MFRRFTHPVLTAILPLIVLGCQGDPGDDDAAAPIVASRAALSRPPEADICRTPGPSTPPHGAGFEATEKKRSWPCNGYVINNYGSAVQVHDDDGYYYIPAHSTSDRFNQDVDFIQEPSSSIWYKIGPFTATVNSDGTVSGWVFKGSP